ncbi:MAG TPA: flagellar motor protein MotD [Porticoccaceae bacterium]|nr:flagellar motor protein MotD [Porticoccaceae bacterium]
MARKKKHEEHENHERWLVSYADFITLLFAFFVVMYSVSSVNEGKYRVLSDSMVAAFRSPAKSLQPIQVGNPAKAPYRDAISVRQAPAVVAAPNLPTPHGGMSGIDSSSGTAAPGAAPPGTSSPGNSSSGASPDSGNGPNAGAALADLQRIAGQIHTAMAPLIEEGVIRVRESSEWVEVEINAEILFPSGSAQLESGAREILAKLAEVIRPFPNPIHVEGFTDNVPISSAIYPSNWELSAGRAASVVHLFSDMAVAPARMVAVGYGEFHPVEDNATDAGRSRNRRVLVVVRSTDVAAGPEATPARSTADSVPGAFGSAVQGGEQAAPVQRDSGGLARPQVIAPPIQLPFSGVIPPPDAGGA